jgi:stress responsive alpha/beta barrel protein
MLTHIVLLRRRPGVSREPDYERTLVRRVRDLKNRLANVSAWSVSANELERPASWEYALQAEFADAGALDAFLSNPAYVQLLLDLKTYFDLAACYFTHV